MSFANFHTEWLEWCVVVGFPTNPPVSTTIDVHTNGNIPILLSLPQMMNLGFDLKMRPDSVKLTCDSLGYHDEVLPFSKSKHVVLDLARVQGSLPSNKSKRLAPSVERTFLVDEAETEVPDSGFSQVDTDTESNWTQLDSNTGAGSR